jgi:hypothetical protein
MQRLRVRAVGYLMTATRAVGDDHGVLRPAYGVRRTAGSIAFDAS